MVALVENGFSGDMHRTSTAKSLPSVICPICKNVIPFPNVLTTRRLTRYGVRIHSFFDWCFVCDKGVQEVAFLRDGVLVVHKWRLYTFNVKGKKGVGQWVIENELPVPAVMFGPGCGYDKYYLTTD